MDHLTLVGGVRFTRAERSFVGCDIDPPQDQGKAATIFNAIQEAVLGSLVKPAVSGGCFTLDQNFLPNEAHETLNQNNVSWRGGLNWKTDGGVLLYADAAKGYKSGSIPAVSAATYKGFQSAPQESLLAYEAGVKAPLFDRALQLNAAAFYYDYKDKQVRGHILDPVFGLVEAMVSIPKSRVWGIESSVAAKPMKGLDLSASVTYLQTLVQSYSGYNATAALQNYAGSEFPFSPKWEAVGDARYSWDIGREKRAFVGANLTGHSVSYASIGVDSNFKMPSYTLLGLRAGIESADDKWRLSFWGENVTNVYYWTGVNQYWDTRFRIAAKPATYGVKFEGRY
jgi:outer membrane receptor protein involved in Fe transport